MAASYIEALIPPEENDKRWNYASPLGTPVSINFSFMAAKPSYSYFSNEGINFNPLTDAQKNATLSLFALYENYINITFNEVPDANDNSTQIRLGRHDTTTGEAGYAYTPGEYVAMFPESALAGDIWIVNGESNTQVEPGESGYSTIMHEIGHALGLKHPFEVQGDHLALPSGEDNNRYSIMSYTEYPDRVFRKVTGTTADDIDFIFVEPTTPMLYDIAALQYLYGANMAYMSDDTTYTFVNNDPFTMCIWDGGGIDTIDVQNFSRSCTINLTAGKFSTISIVSDPLPDGFTGGTPPTYTGVDNLSIAYGAIIENAVGGSGNDKLTGNAVKNTLTGNNGNDVLDGGAGNDVLNGGSGIDKLIGGAGNDKLMCESTDTRIDGGVGTGDVLDLASGSLDILPTRVKNIEIIDLRGGGANTVTLDRADIVAISSTDKLKIMGDVGDTVDFTGTLPTPTGTSLKLYNLGGGVQLSVESDVLVV